MKPTIKPTKTQHQAWSILKDNSHEFTYLLFGGAAGGGKSWLGSEWLLTNCYFYPGSRWFIGREELKRLRESTLITFFKVCRHHKIPDTDFKYNGQDNYLIFKNGSRIDLLDLRYLPSDPLYERYGSIEYTGGWIEEGGEVHFDAFDTLKSRIGRYHNDDFGINAKMLITCNPKRNWTYSTFYQPHRNKQLEAGYYFIQSLVKDNPYIEKNYIRTLHEIKDKSKKERLLLGNWEYINDPDALISPEAAEAIFTNDHLEKQPPQRYIIADIARFGSDRAIITVWEGMKIIDVVIFDKSALTEIQKAIISLRIKYKVPLRHCLADADGVGGGVIDNLHIVGFVNNGKPFDKNYQNLKSECGYKLADEIENIYIEYILPDKEIEIIKDELGMLKTYDSDKDGKLRILPKEKIKESIGRSPDWLDIFIMRQYFEIKPKERRRVL